MDLDLLNHQEHILVFDRFDEDTAWEIGSALVAVARAQKAPVVVNIRTSDRTLFHAALAGAVPANDSWARRKSNLTLREHQSSMKFGMALKAKGKTLADHGIDFADYADHGGSFPVRVKGVGVIAAITVSGLASAEDHAMIVGVLADWLKVDVI
ncbi:heme-degrading domain-containing protein [Thalassospira alkalitolerans]|uniref:heme-degrading domain-containing protein n=1 Tax=Thalassospira alkalitolerans TaxID=1293890 RepID=UPI0030EB95F3|tara:strand:- start:70397 stop:70858 length:462 start_codon:yes stop_codon:yes gene_type:complete